MTPIRPLLYSAVALAMLSPVVVVAQRAPSRTTPLQSGECRPSDSTLSSAFRTGVSSPAAPPPAGTQAITGGTVRSHEYPEYDVVLDIPALCVEKIYLKVDSLTAKLALKAQIANLVTVNAGADVLVGDVDLTIKGVRAQALLLVDLDDVVHIVDQTLTFVDNHPEVIKQLAGTIGNAGSAVGGLVNGLLLGTSRNALGQTVQRLVDQATGSIVEKTLSTAGQAIAQKAVGSVLNLPVLKETAGAAGQVVRQVRDQAGSVIEYTFDKASNKISALRVLQNVR